MIIIDSVLRSIFLTLVSSFAIGSYVYMRINKSLKRNRNIFYVVRTFIFFKVAMLPMILFLCIHMEVSQPASRTYVIQCHSNTVALMFMF